MWAKTPGTDIRRESRAQNTRGRSWRLPLSFPPGGFEAEIDELENLRIILPPRTSGHPRAIAMVGMNRYEPVM